MRKSRLSQGKQDRLTEHFVAGTTSRTASTLVSVNKNTSAYYYLRLRELIWAATEDTTPFCGEVEVEVDESYFDGRRKGKCGRGAAGKVPVFGLLKRGGRVYTRITPDARSATLMPIMKEKIQPDSIVYTDAFVSYNVLDVSEFRHYRINHSALFADRKNHINWIENFWDQAKRYIRKFNGIPRTHFHLYLRECEWRFNNPDPNTQLQQLKQLVREKIG